MLGTAAPSLVGLMLAPPSMPHPELALLGDGRDDCDAHARRSSSSVSAGRYQERRTRPTGYRLGQLIASPYACPPRARPGGSFLQRHAIVRLARRSGPTTMANTSRQPACTTPPEGPASRGADAAGDVAPGPCIPCRHRQQMGAATSVGRDPHRDRQTVMDRDHRFRREGPSTWRFSRRFTGLNTPKFK